MSEGIGKGGKRWMKVFNFIMEEGDAALFLISQLSTIDLEMRGETKSGDDLRVSWNNDDLQLLFINLKRYWQDACSMEKKQSQVLALIYHGLEDHQQTSCQTCKHHAKRVLYLVQTRDPRCGQSTPRPSCVMVESQSMQ